MTRISKEQIAELRTNLENIDAVPRSFGPNTGRLILQLLADRADMEAEIERLQTDFDALQMTFELNPSASYARIASLEAKLAAETERCSKIAESYSGRDEAFISPLGIAAAIRASRPSDEGTKG